VAVPYEKTVFVPCANGGAGEYVQLSGSTNFVYQLVWTDHGFNLGYHANSYAIKGVGLLSGETFVASAGTEGTVAAVWENDHWVATTIERLRVTGQNTNFVLKNVYHITTNADDEVVVQLNKQEAECN